MRAGPAQALATSGAAVRQLPHPEDLSHGPAGTVTSDLILAGPGAAAPFDQPYARLRAAPLPPAASCFVRMGRSQPFAAAPAPCMSGVTMR